MATGVAQVGVRGMVELMGMAYQGLDAVAVVGLAWEVGIRGRGASLVGMVVAHPVVCHDTLYSVAWACRLWSLNCAPEK